MVNGSQAARSNCTHGPVARHGGNKDRVVAWLLQKSVPTHTGLQPGGTATLKVPASLLGPAVAHLANWLVSAAGFLTTTNARGQGQGMDPISSCGVPKSGTACMRPCQET